MIDTGQKLPKEMKIQEQELNKHFPSEMSGVIGGNTNNCIEKRESNVTAKHPIDTELIV